SHLLVEANRRGAHLDRLDGKRQYTPRDAFNISHVREVLSRGEHRTIVERHAIVLFVPHPVHGTLMGGEDFTPSPDAVVTLLRPVEPEVDDRQFRLPVFAIFILESIGL